MATSAELIATAAERLAKVTETAHLDAEILLAHALGLPRASLLAQLQEEVVESVFWDLVERREHSEPIAYILGEWEFFSLTFDIEPPALVPRPETEHLVEAVLEFVGDSPARILEIGTGSGCVAIAISKNAPNTRTIATDVNLRFVDLAQQNAVNHGLDWHIDFREGDLFDVVSETDGPFDVICSNPPYIESGAFDSLPPTVRDYEDPAALLSGADGLDCIRRLAADAQAHLRPGGLLAFEIGMGQYGAVREILEHDGYANIRFVKDLSGIERIALGNAPE